MAFQGIPAEAFDFYDALAADNTRTFWAEHKGAYEASVRAPMLALAGALEPEFGPGHLYRPYRDVRFSKDKTPYKDHQGLFVESRNGLGWYVQIGVHGLMAAGGWYVSTPDQVTRYRDAVAHDDSGTLAALLDDAAATGLLVGGQQLKTRPRGVPADHPRLELLRYRTLYLTREWPAESWLGTPAAAATIASAWRSMSPVTDWLAGVVGPGDPPTGSRTRS